MKKIIRKLIPDSAVNYGKHLPDAIVANIRYGFPSRGLKVIGVTGTDGKTTTVNMIYKILKDSGRKVSMISTINAVIGNSTLDTGFHVTNPGRQELQRLIKKARAEGSEYLILETTSQGLVQFRNWGINFLIGVITNITPEHLDYHKTFENYIKAKSILIKNSKVAILNEDDANFNTLKKIAFGKIVTFGKNAEFNPKKFKFRLKLPGEYNVYNALAAAAVATEIGIAKDQIEKSLNSFDSLSGRMEEVTKGSLRVKTKRSFSSNKKGFRIFIDFAHTPNALENALKTLRKENPKKLIAVFGAASERDTQKRPVMGKIASELSDLVILTDEDPRFEDSMKIIDEICAGINKNFPKENLFKIPNRKSAIKKALEVAKKGDIIGIFGKGHENSMNYKGKELPWSDKEAVKKLI